MTAPRRFWPAAMLLLAAMAALQVASVLQESQTIDESAQIVTGYAYLKTGAYTLGLEHPPLLKLLFALPLASLNPRLPAEYPRTPVDGGEPAAGLDFLYRNTIPADTLLFRARMVAIGISTLLGVAIAFWARRWFGPGAALLALWLYACDPNFIAHGRYIKNDVGLALTLFLACAVWGNYLLTEKTRDLLLAGLCCGIALSTKFSAVLLFPAGVMMYIVRWWQVRRAGEKLPLKKLMGPLTVMMCVAFLVVWAAYRFQADTLAGSGLLAKMRKIPVLLRLIEASPAGGPVTWFAGQVPIPATSFLRGVVADGYMNAVGRPDTYLWGRISASGWWYYSLAVLLVKTPAAVLSFCVLVFLILVGRARRRPLAEFAGRLRAAPFPWFVIAIPPVLYLLSAMMTSINSGTRHLLAVYPFLFVFLGAVLARWCGERARIWRRVVVALGLAALAVETAAIYPHYLAFFNLFAGGPTHGPRYLLDSNLDWGQDARRLKAYLDSRNVSDACVSYYGFADLKYYGISQRPLPPLDRAEQLRTVDCLVAVSVSNLYPPHGRFPTLRSLEPNARIGYSIYIYDLRSRRDEIRSPQPPDALVPNSR